MKAHEKSPHKQSIDSCSKPVLYQIGGAKLLPALVVLCFWCPSCAFQTFDKDTGTAHLWGFGHLALSTQQALDDSKLQAVTVASDAVGVSVDTTSFSSGLGLGYQGKRVSYVVKDNTALRIERPHQNGFSLSRGFPFLRKAHDTQTHTHMP